METPKTTSSAKYEFLSFCTRLGKIFSNLSIIFLILCFAGVLSFVSTAFILLIGLMLIIMTLGTIFVMVPNYWDGLTNASQISSNISMFFLENSTLFISLAIGFAVISLIFLLIDKRERPVARIVISSIVVAIAIISMIVIISGVIK